MRIALIIPVFNGGAKFKAILQEVRQYFPPEDTFIIDDGSSDKCTENLEMEGYSVTRHPENCGKGWALRSAFRLVCSRDYEFAITIDADGQHPPSYLPHFISTLENQLYDIVIGNRRKNFKDMPFDRKLSNLITSVIISLISGRKILDSQCGFRGYSVAFLKKITIRTYSYETETELLLKALGIGLEIGWIEIPVIYQGEESHIHRLRDTWKFISLILLYIFGGLCERSV